jgi:hypothetical protein
MKGDWKTKGSNICEKYDCEMVSKSIENSLKQLGELFHGPLYESNPFGSALMQHGKNVPDAEAIAWIDVKVISMGNEFFQ